MYFTVPQTLGVKVCKVGGYVDHDGQSLAGSQWFKFQKSVNGWCHRCTCWQKNFCHFESVQFFLPTFGISRFSQRTPGEEKIATRLGFAWHRWVFVCKSSISFFIQLKCYWRMNAMQLIIPPRPSDAKITIWYLFFLLCFDDLLNVMLPLPSFKTSPENQSAAVSFHATRRKMDCVLFRRLHSRIPAVLFEILWNCQSELFSAGWVAAVTGELGEKAGLLHAAALQRHEWHFHWF